MRLSVSDPFPLKLRQARASTKQLLPHGGGRFDDGCHPHHRPRGGGPCLRAFTDADLERLAREKNARDEELSRKRLLRIARERTTEARRSQPVAPITAIGDVDMAVPVKLVDRLHLMAGSTALPFDHLLLPGGRLDGLPTPAKPVKELAGVELELVTVAADAGPFSASAPLRAPSQARAPAWRRNDLRHRRGSLWHASGMPARELAERMGHSKASMSLDVYTHVMPPDEVAPERIEAALQAPRRTAPAIN